VDLKAKPPGKKKFTIVEDNDSIGHTSKKAVAAKEDSKITAVALPRYSPDLSPLDFFLWLEVELILQTACKERFLSQNTRELLLTRASANAVSGGDCQWPGPFGILGMKIWKSRSKTLQKGREDVTFAGR
jgi:hypothetical protein